MEAPIFSSKLIRGGIECTIFFFFFFFLKYKFKRGYFYSKRKKNSNFWMLWICNYFSKFQRRTTFILIVFNASILFWSCSVIKYKYYVIIFIVIFNAKVMKVSVKFPTCAWSAICSSNVKKRMVRNFLHHAKLVCPLYECLVAQRIGWKFSQLQYSNQKLCQSTIS